MRLWDTHASLQATNRNCTLRSAEGGDGGVGGGVGVGGER